MPHTQAHSGVALRQGRQPATRHPIDSWAHASALVRGFIQANDLTASGDTGPMWTGGDVQDGHGRIVARVSYNGTVWGPEPWRSGAVPLYDPSDTGRATAGKG